MQKTMYIPTAIVVAIFVFFVWFFVFFMPNQSRVLWLETCTTASIYNGTNPDDAAKFCEERYLWLEAKRNEWSRGVARPIPAPTN